jgi:hypothetical protein
MNDIQFIPYEPMKSKFHMTIITKLWPIKFVMWANLQKVKNGLTYFWNFTYVVEMVVFCLLN